MNAAGIGRSYHITALSTAFVSLQQCTNIFFPRPKSLYVNPFVLISCLRYFEDMYFIFLSYYTGLIVTISYIYNIQICDIYVQVEIKWSFFIVLVVFDMAHCISPWSFQSIVAEIFNPELFVRYCCLVVRLSNVLLKLSWAYMLHNDEAIVST